MNESSVAGTFNEAKGKLKQAAGEALGDQSLANSGAADELKGHAQQTWGSVKDTAHEIGHKAHASVDRTTPYDPSDPSYSTDPAYRDEHNVRAEVTNAAEDIKHSIQHGLDKLKH